MPDEALKWKVYPNCQIICENILINYEENTRHSHHEKKQPKGGNITYSPGLLKLVGPTITLTWVLLMEIECGSKNGKLALSTVDSHDPTMSFNCIWMLHLKIISKDCNEKFSFPTENSRALKVNNICMM